MSPTITIQLAKTTPEFEAAFRLLQRSREQWGIESPDAGKLWVLKHHALPATNTIVALQAGRVIGAICLFGESPFHLPAEDHLDLKSFRKSFEGRVAELSLPGLEADFAGHPDVLHALYHFAVCFGTTNCDYDGFLTEAPLAWANDHAEDLRYRRIFEPMAGRQLLFLDVRAEELDFRTGISAGTKVEYFFPEKKFFLVAHQSMQPAVLNYLFNERTRVFASLSDADLRVLKNVYDWGDYAKLLPSRPLDLPSKKTPRFPRFPMNCEGFLVNSDGSREHVHLLDVSREGLKIKSAQAPDSGASHVLTLYVGVNKKSEVIARVVWVDEHAGISGLEIRSSDERWAQLIDYLEKDYLRVA